MLSTLRKTTTICSQLLFILIRSFHVVYLSGSFLFSTKLENEICQWKLASGSLMRKFIQFVCCFFFLLARIYKHTRTSRYHQRWQCYALNRFRMPFKFVQNTSILLAMRCGIYIFHMAHTQMIQNRPMGFATIQKSNLQFPLGMLTLSLSLSPMFSVSISNALTLFGMANAWNLAASPAETNPRPDKIL